MERRLAAILAADVVGYSRLIRADEEGTISALKKLREDLFDPTIAEHNGRIVKLMGDGILAEFPSIVGAVRAATDVQIALAVNNADLSKDGRIEFRAGINIGDVVIDGDDIQGDGINVAARLESMCEPGGLCISDVVYQSIEGKTELLFADLGEQKLKNIDTPIRVWSWVVGAGAGQNVAATNSEIVQEVKFCTTRDGTNIAYALIGDGPPLLKSPNWMNHLEHDWDSPIWRHLLRGLTSRHTLLRFDQRANGLSDWDVADVTFESMVSDMEDVVEAAGLEKFSVLGISQGCSYSIAYAVRNPERVSRLVLYGGFAVGALRTGVESDREERLLMARMMAQGWGQDNPAFRQAFTTMFMPDATKDHMDWFNELQRTTASPENAVRLYEVAGSADVRDLLPQVSVPTLVIHCRDDGIVPFDRGRKMAAGIPGARFVALEGRNHLTLETEPAWPRFLDEVLRFLAEDETAV